MALPAAMIRYSFTLTPGDVRLRFNNWDRMRARRAPTLLFSAASAGAGAFLFAMGLIGLLDRARSRS
jgi:hypothetical protein